MGYTKLSGGQRTARGIVYSGDGQGKVYAYAVAACTKNKPYYLTYTEYGREATALGTAGTNVMIGAAEKTLATGEYGWFIVEGKVELTTASDAVGTAGNAFKVHTDGTVICTDAAYSGAANEFAVGMEAEATATSHTVYMIPREITWS